MRSLPLFIATLTTSIALSTLPASGQQRQLPSSQAEVQLSFAPVVKQTTPAVVNIYTRKVVQQRQQVASPLLNDPFFRQFFGDQLRLQQQKPRVQNSLGSGVIVESDGLIVTNYHVIREADQITVALSDRREFEAKVVRTDERVDLAVLKIEAKGLPTLSLRDSDTIEVGDLVLAIGNPFGVGQTVTTGIVSGLARTNAGITDYNFFIQTDAAINPGNSGGALVTMDGRLIGINTAIYSRSGGSIGIGFAIPANMVRTMIAGGADANAKVVRAWFGASGQPVTQDLASSLNLARPYGVLINGTFPGSPAERAGLMPGDVVTAIDGREVDDPESLRFRIATLPIGSSAELSYFRKGQAMKTQATLIAPPENPPRDETQMKGNQPLAGATIVNLSPAMVEELGIPGPSQGVMITDIAQGSPAGRVGFRPGDLMVQVNATQIDTVTSLRTAMEKPSQSGWKITFKRGEETLTASFKR
ncbi:DegQ family serine endoprotease [Lacibacterium aquatile]|uniref:DegQ family serine endoprotease n=1 Tax=Lacibacterium aquatile TaxID=1168082 RepID=A0ABW5DR90_9PROT